MDYYFGFNSPEEREKRRQTQLYEVSEVVTKFFWDDAPEKFHFEEREGQQDMAFEILDAIKNGQHIAVEAGVGIGKSFAYSVPLLLYSKKTSVPIVIATSTIALQEQLLNDINRLEELLGINVDVTLVKGQTHYLCSKRADEYLADSKAILHDEIQLYMNAGQHDRRSISCTVPDSIWEKINIFRFSKRGCAACHFRDSCQYYKLRNDLKLSNGITLCNQDLLTAHLLQRSRGQDGLLNTDGGIIVIDEAHNLEDKVRSATTEHFGQSNILGTIAAAEREVRSEEKSFIRYDVSAANKAVKALFQNLNQQLQKQVRESTQDMKYADRFFFGNSDHAISLIEEVASCLESLASSIQIYTSLSFRRETNYSASDDLSAIAKSFTELSSAIDEKLIWLERHGSYTDLVFCPKNTNEIISSLYFKGPVTTILTSATLSNAAEGSLENQYSYFIQNTGFPLDESGVFSEPKPSPFPYDEHAMVYYCNDLPHPTKEHDAFIEQGVERLVQVLDVSHGKALVLFTAKTDMEEVYAMLQKRELPYKILMQQTGSSQERVLDEFKRDVDSVLLGTGAYWEGIDIQGKSLSNLVIFRLPFPVPDPIVEYKASVANDSLMEVSVPEMIIKLKQGIGRLIRNNTDTGIVGIIDSRLRDDAPERYHDITWASLPIRNRTTSLEDIRAFYSQIAHGGK